MAAATALPLVPEYGVFEHTVSFSTAAANPWEQVGEHVTLTDPHGRRTAIGGFWSGGRAWTFRFAPATVGVWTWAARVVDAGHSIRRSGSFRVVRASSPGFVVRSPINRFRWSFTNGEPYDPIGLQDCTAAVYTDNPLTGFGFDGGHDAPPRWTSLDPYLSAYAAAGFNLFRWGPNNCSFGLYDRIDPRGNVYSQQGAAYADQLVSALRGHGFRIEFVLFGSTPPFPSGSQNGAEMSAVERYVRYIVDRYGAYVDFWELANEATPSTGWIDTAAGFLRRIDPYHHPIGTSWSRPDLAAIDFGSDHWYQTEPDLSSDLVAWQRLRRSPRAASGSRRWSTSRATPGTTGTRPRPCACASAPGPRSSPRRRSSSGTRARPRTTPPTRAISTSDRSSAATSGCCRAGCRASTRGRTS